MAWEPWAACQDLCHSQVAPLVLELELLPQALLVLLALVQEQVLRPTQRWEACQVVWVACQAAWEAQVVCSVTCPQSRCSK